MAGAFVFSVDFDSQDDTLTLTLNVLFFGAGLKDRSFVTVPVLATDTLATVKSKLVTAITTEANSLGYSVPVSNIILPVFQKGA